MLYAQLRIPNKVLQQPDVQYLARKAELLPRLRRIYVQPWIPSRGNPSALQAGRMANELSRVASADRTGARFVLMEQSMYDGEATFEDWKNCIEGGRGPWREVGEIRDQCATYPMAL
ncbi:hypothetical protein PUNSTDRAFT_113398 [Punctularia strigosozonata HHB-11173 SS5]|uniref:uncharacterized protein n=1 Tax=Punctularia strigosozonata (strain HHB-11173) TaxID=741275 RepID=UPI0004416655|nr:uncharacterized protein PUNSTDRAFT_113398 [Punctularia strigosozonata HHB-11173 SS5]EIN08740.1 hypothetical protein PUNSTDRAFT_113398 [Punctularia strigosozonata HHB-11173 SS5]